MTVKHLKYCVIFLECLPPFPLPSLLCLNDVLFSQFLCWSSVVSGWKNILFSPPSPQIIALEIFVLKQCITSPITEVL